LEFLLIAPASALGSCFDEAAIGSVREDFHPIDAFQRKKSLGSRVNVITARISPHPKAIIQSQPE
jgi:hypothetical protein